MSMMMRRGTPGQLPRQDYSALDIVADPRFPEVAGIHPASVPSGELRARLEGLAAQHFTGYWHLGQAARLGGGQGVVLFNAGQPIYARVNTADGVAALAHLVNARKDDEVLLTAHPLNREVTLALSAAFLTPEAAQPLGSDAGEVALVLRDLAGIRHSGVIQVGAHSPHLGMPVWARVLMYEGKILGVYSGSDRHLKASLADVAPILAESAPHLLRFSLQTTPVALPLPKAEAPQQSHAPGATPERDERLETDLIWFMSRFERAFGRLKERRDPQADLLRAFGELANELAGFVATLSTGAATPSGAQGVIAAEMARGRAAGAIKNDFKLGKAGIDAAALAKGYGAQPRRSAAARDYFSAASTDILTLIGRLMERMVAAFYDPTSAAFAREGCETLLREVRGGLNELAH